ncbi:MAG: T9SS type A sorting domain-containing protein [candidate division WOR-3 bacterium]
MMLISLIAQVQCNSIYNIQYNRDANQNSLCKDSANITITGIVFTPVGITGTRNFYIYENPYGAWRGILVYSSSSTNFPTLNPGDSVVIIVDSVKEYFGNTELLVKNNYNIYQAGSYKPLPSPNIITGAHLDTTANSAFPVDSAEAYEGTLVRINNATIIGLDSTNFGTGWKVAKCDDGTGIFYFRYGHSGFNYIPQIGQKVNIQGVVYTRYGQYVIVPRDDNDAQVVSNNEQKYDISFNITRNKIVFNVPQNERIKVLIYSVDGKKIIEKLITHNDNQVQLKSGIYILKLNNKVKRIVIN